MKNQCWFIEVVCSASYNDDIRCDYFFNVDKTDHVPELCPYTMMLLSMHQLQIWKELSIQLHMHTEKFGEL